MKKADQSRPFVRFKHRSRAGSIFAETIRMMGTMATTSLLKEIDSGETIIDANSVLPNPDAVLRKSGIALATYRELMTDPQISGAFVSREARTLRLLWWLNPEGTDGTGIAETEAALRRLNVRQKTETMLGGIKYGYQPMEVIWSDESTVWMPRDLKDRTQEHFAFSRSGNLLFRKSGSLTPIVVRRFDGREPAPDEIVKKFLVPRNGPSSGNPYGFPILSLCFWPLALKRGGLEFWSAFTEKYGMPWTVAEMPDFAGTEEERQQQAEDYLKHIEAMVQDAVLVIEKGLVVDIKSGASTASVDIYDRFLRYQDDQMSKAILSNTGLIDPTAGRLGGEDGALDVLEAVGESDKSMIEQEWQTLVDWIYDLNWPGVTVPRFELYRYGDVNRTIADRDAVLAQSLGVMFTASYIAKTYSIPPDSFTVQPRSAAPATPAFSEADHPQVPIDQQTVDQFVGSFTPEQLQYQMSKAIDPVLDYLAGGSDYSETMDALAGLFPKMNTADLESVLAKSIFITMTIGRLSADGEH